MLKVGRRRFLGWIATLSGIGHIAPLTQASTYKQVELQRSLVAGFQFYQGEVVWPLLVPGAPLDLVREPNNPHDPQAVRLDWQGHKLGYVPRVDNTAINHLLDNHQPVTARIVDLQPSYDPWKCIEFAVYLGR